MPDFSDIQIIIGTGENAREVGRLSAFEPQFVLNSAVSRILGAIVRARFNPPEVLAAASLDPTHNKFELDL